MIDMSDSHYRIISTLGAGGMGVVYLAEDERLQRKIALKCLSPAAAQDADARARLLREARAASALDHPNIAGIYDIGERQGQLFIAMPFYDGETLHRRITRGPLPVAEAARIAGDIAAGLAAAHAAGIVHRDLKPANVMLTHDGQVRIVDFGLAKVFSDTQDTVERMTVAGATVGTVAYMAPEQANGLDVTARADIWAFGVTLYEMLTGHLPFDGPTMPAMLLAAASRQPPPIRLARPDVPEELERIVERALEKDPARRTMTASEIAADIGRWRSRSSASQILQAAARRSTTKWWIAIAAVALLAAAIPGAYFLRQNARTRWAREQALPQIERLADAEQFAPAFTLAQQARGYIPNDPVWQRIDPIVSRRVTVETTPPDASVSYHIVGADSGWTTLGTAPIVDGIVPNAYLEWRIDKPGYVTATDATVFVLNQQRLALLATLHTPEQTPPGMVHVTAGPQPRVAVIAGLTHLPAQRVRDFWIDRYEVTNRDYKRFLDAGGYRDPKPWPHPFVENGRTLTFNQAMARFTDSTGRPGPATWESGNFLDGQDDLPVRGVSWYEAAAFLAWSGKSLPTIFHWSLAADQRMSGTTAPRSNFSGRGPMKVGASGGMNRFGTFDLAGNVKEWCSNRPNETQRYILGGAWDEPAYLFNDPDARSPFERAPNFGFRGVKYSEGDEVASAELVSFVARDFRHEQPVGDDVFAAYRALYDYDKADLAVRAEATDDSGPDWRVEKVSFSAAYGGERVPAFAYLPRHARPPYQAVVYFPNSGVLAQRSSAVINTRAFDWVLRSGRALILPVYKSTFERGDELTSDFPAPTTMFRDHVIAWGKDVRRTVDYLESRSDIDPNRIAYVGQSWGGTMAPVFLAVEPRFKAAVIVVGGFYVQRARPEVEAINFAPRARVPVLMLNGRFDFYLPEDTTQIPMFQLLGASESQKRRVVYDTGHNVPRADLIRESLDWLDRYLGPVQ